MSLLTLRTIPADQLDLDLIVSVLSADELVTNHKKTRLVCGFDDVEPKSLPADNGQAQSSANRSCLNTEPSIEDPIRQVGPLWAYWLLPPACGSQDR